MRRVVRGRHIDTRSPRGYYRDYSSLADPRAPVDSDGLPTLRRPGEGHEHSPLDVARFGLGNLEVYLENGAPERRDRFRRSVGRLREMLEIVPSSFGGWAMPPAPGPYRRLLPSGRFAAGAQGECLSAVVRAWALLGLEGAEKTAKCAFAAFTAPVEDGGFSRDIGDSAGDVTVDSPAFMEEYPIEQRAVLDLSGHMRAMLGIYDYWSASGDAAARAVWRRCVAGLESVLPRYDLGYWTRDDLDAGRVRPKTSSVSSLREHVLHLSVLADLAESDVFRRTAGRWGEYSASFWRRVGALRARIAPGLSAQGR